MKKFTKGSEAPDLKEFFQYGQVFGDNYKEEEYPENVMVEEVPFFNSTFDMQNNMRILI